MHEKKLDAFEVRARNAGGKRAGEYLEGLGLADTPLGQLDQDTWFQFLTHIVQGFEDSMREQLLNHQAPF